jgi:hypothetical protein
MPAESIRLHRQVRPRDRWFVGVVVAATLAVTPVAVIATEHGPSRPAGCVTTLRAGFMGGQTGTFCGAKAAAVCRREGASDASLAAECRQEGLTVGAPRP